MDDPGTWPAPLPADDGADARAFDRQVMAEVRSDPQALQQIGDVRGNVLVVLVPFLAAIATIALLLQWLRTDSALWLGVLAAVLVAGALIWISRVRAIMTQAKEVLGGAAAGSAGYGIGVIRELTVRSGLEDDAPHPDSPDTPDEDAPDEETPLAPVEAELTLAITPTTGPPFTATVHQRYAAVDALSLQRGQHGPVRFLRRSPETTVSLDTRLSPDAVQRLYRAAALNG